MNFRHEFSIDMDLFGDLNITVCFYLSEPFGDVTVTLAKPSETRRIVSTKKDGEGSITAREYFVIIKPSNMLVFR